MQQRKKLIMELNFNPAKVDEYYDKWNRLGWAGTGETYKEFVDPEKLLIETTHVGRYEGRLLKAMMTWVRDFHDLINVQRLLHYIENADLAVLGAVIEIAMQNGANHRLQTILKHCKPNKTPEVLFKTGDQLGYFDDNQKKHAKEEFLKWGLCCTQLEFYDDAMRTRQYVLKNNPLLALRAFIGPNIRSEILFELGHKTRHHIRGLSQKIGYAYSAVYNEVSGMVENGYLTLEKYGRTKVVIMNSKMAKYLANIPS
jgi:hypothetical protein